MPGGSWRRLHRLVCRRQDMRGWVGVCRVTRGGCCAVLLPRPMRASTPRPNPNALRQQLDWTLLHAFVFTCRFLGSKVLLHVLSICRHLQGRNTAASFHTARKKTLRTYHEGRTNTGSAEIASFLTSCDISPVLCPSFCVLARRCSPSCHAV